MIAIDLTPALLEARHRASDWSARDFRRVTKRIQELYSDLTIERDEGAGEEWCVIGHGGKDPVGLGVLRVDAPLALIVGETSDSLIKSLVSEGIVVVHAPNWEGQDYSIDRQRLPDIFPHLTWPFDAVNPSQLSIHELWWATV